MFAEKGTSASTSLEFSVESQFRGIRVPVAPGVTREAFDILYEFDKNIYGPDPIDAAHWGPFNNVAIYVRNNIAALRAQGKDVDGLIIPYLSKLQRDAEAKQNAPAKPAESVELSRDQLDAFLRTQGCPEEVFQGPEAVQKRHRWFVGWMAKQMVNFEKASGEFISATPNTFNIPYGENTITGATLAKSFSAFDGGVEGSVSEQLRINMDMMSDILSKGDKYYEVHANRAELKSFWLKNPFDVANFGLYEAFPPMYYEVGGQYYQDDMSFADRFKIAVQAIFDGDPIPVATGNHQFPTTYKTNPNSLFPSFGEGVDWDRADYERLVDQYVARIGRATPAQALDPRLNTPAAAKARGRFALQLAYNLHAYFGTGWKQDAGPNPQITERGSGYISSEYLTRLHSYRDYGLKLIKEGASGGVRVGKTNPAAIERFQRLVLPFWDHVTVDGMRLGDKVRTIQHWSDLGKDKFELSAGVSFGKAMEAGVLVFEIINESGYLKSKNWSQIKHPIPGSEGDYAYDPELAETAIAMYRDSTHYFVERDHCKKFDARHPNPPSPDFRLFEMPVMLVDAEGRPIKDGNGAVMVKRDPAGNPVLEKVWSRYHKMGVVRQGDLASPGTAQVNILKRTHFRNLLIADIARGDNVNIRQNDIEAMGQLLIEEVRLRAQKRREGRGILKPLYSILSPNLPPLEGLNVMTESQLISALKDAGVPFNIGRYLRDFAERIPEK